jgi:putative ABC transport system permease protein
LILVWAVEINIGMDFDLDELLSSGVGSYNFEWLLTFLKGMIKPLAATAVVLVAVILSYMQNLGLGGEMVYSIVRAFLQLSVIGFVLQFIFSQDHAVWIILAYIFMVRINLFLFLFLINIFNLQVLYMLAW